MSIIHRLRRALRAFMFSGPDSVSVALADDGPRGVSRSQDMRRFRFEVVGALNGRVLEALTGRLTCTSSQRTRLWSRLSRWPSRSWSRGHDDHYYHYHGS